MEKNIGFIGAGNMAGAMIGGLLRAKIFSPEQVWASAPGMAHLDVYKRQVLMKMQGYSTKEIAKIVHLKPNAIYGRMNTLRKKLKKFI